MPSEPRSGSLRERSTSRDCPYCEGAGCTECGDTGKRVVTYANVDGITVRITGTAEMTPETVEAFALIAQAAFDRIRNPTEGDAA